MKKEIQESGKDEKASESEPVISCCADDRTIKAHIRNHYEHLYEGRQVCRVPVRMGRNLAAALGYPLDSLDFIPQSHWDKFVPCGNPLRLVQPIAGEQVLNLGCGAAIDSFALSALHGASVRVVNVDVVFSVLQEASELAQSLSKPSHPELCRSPAQPRGALHWVCGDGEQLPFQTGVFQWIIMNGVFNLFPDKVSLLGEVNRVLSPAGQLVGTDLCVDAPLPDYFYEERDAWAWCMSGARTEGELRRLLREAGFEEIRLNREEDEDMFYRTAFSCRKGSIAE